MKGPSEGTGDDIEEICISQLSYFSGGSLEKAEHRIFVELSEGDAFTLPIRFCPMCGERFPEVAVAHDSLERIKADMRLDTCVYAKKRGIGHGVNASDEQAACASCEWAAGDCDLLMRMDLSDRLGKLLDEEDKR